MSDNPVFDRIQSEIDTNDVVLFMKGSPMFPQCGFSAAVTQALTTLEVKFKGVDVMEDGDIRNGIVVSIFNVKYAVTTNSFTRDSLRSR